VDSSSLINALWPRACLSFLLSASRPKLASCLYRGMPRSFSDITVYNAREKRRRDCRPFFVPALPLSPARVHLFPVSSDPARTLIIVTRCRAPVTYAGNFSSPSIEKFIVRFCAALHAGHACSPSRSLFLGYFFRGSPRVKATGGFWVSTLPSSATP